MSYNKIHVRIDGITHEALQYESHGVLSLACETWKFPPPGLHKYRSSRVGVDVGLATSVDCMTCLVRMAPR